MITKSETIDYSSDLLSQCTARLKQLLGPKDQVVQLFNLASNREMRELIAGSIRNPEHGKEHLSFL